MTPPTTRPRRTLRGGIALLLAAGSMAGLANVATADDVDCSTVPWMDPSASAEDRTQALLDASTQHQKYRWLNEQAANSPQQATFSGVTYPLQVACTPLVIYANGAEGVHSTAGTTAWPTPLAIAATWDTALGEQKATVHAGETFDNRKAVVLGPGVASGRTPLLGRTPEYFGEDPLLSGLMAAANVRGLETGNPDKPVVANLKHYVANEQELDRQTSSSNLDERTLRQTYDLPYEIAVKESDPGSVMCSFNQVNGVWACENPILNENLRGEMGFDGYVMSDFGSVHSTAASLKNGLDQELNRPVWYTPARLDAALAAGEITQAHIDTAARNVVLTYIEKGLFDHPVPAVAVPNVSTPDSKALARTIAEESTVLLKNDGDVLPLADEPLTVAVIGQTASTSATGGVSAKTACASVFGTRQILNCDALVDPLTAISQRVEAAGGQVLYDNGADPAAAAIASLQADVTIVFGYVSMGEGKDLTDLHLQGNGDALIAEVAATAKHTVVVLNSGTAVEMPWLADVDAVLHGWYSGEQAGPALASLLWGDVNPSAKLPMTFPKSLADTPAAGSTAQYPGVFSDGSTTRPVPGEIRQVSYSEGLQVGYKWYDEQGIEPLFPFGHGLSYTTFGYSDLDVESTTDPATGAVSTTVAVTVTNTGDVAGTEVPQVYLTLPDAADEPGKRLVGFDRVDLAAGASTRVEVVVDSAASNQPYSVWDVDADAWRVVEGEYGIAVGASSRDLPLAGTFRVGPPAETLDVTTTVTSRCVAGKNILTATATNHEDVPVALTFDSPFGSKSFAAVQPGANAFHGFTTRQASLAAGALTVTGSAVVGGQTVGLDQDVPYPAASCG
jgi:beta-glucosidase